MAAIATKDRLCLICLNPDAKELPGQGHFSPQLCLYFIGYNVGESEMFGTSEIMKGKLCFCPAHTAMLDSAFRDRSALMGDFFQSLKTEAENPGVRTAGRSKDLGILRRFAFNKLVLSSLKKERDEPSFEVDADGIRVESAAGTTADEVEKQVESTLSEINTTAASVERQDSNPEDKNVGLDENEQVETTSISEINTTAASVERQDSNLEDKDVGPSDCAGIQVKIEPDLDAASNNEEEEDKKETAFDPIKTFNEEPVDYEEDEDSVNQSRKTEFKEEREDDQSGNDEGDEEGQQSIPEEKGLRRSSRLKELKKKQKCHERECLCCPTSPKVNKKRKTRKCVKKRPALTSKASVKRKVQKPRRGKISSGGKKKVHAKKRSACRSRAASTQQVSETPPTHESECDDQPPRKKAFKMYSNFEDPELNPVNWSVADVTAFIGNFNECSDYAEKFATHGIDGQALMLITEEDLTSSDIGMKLGPALKLVNYLRLLNRYKSC